MQNGCRSPGCWRYSLSSPWSRRKCPRHMPSTDRGGRGTRRTGPGMCADGRGLPAMSGTAPGTSKADRGAAGTRRTGPGTCADGPGPTGATQEVAPGTRRTGPGMSADGRGLPATAAAGPGTSKGVPGSRATSGTAPGTSRAAPGVDATSRASPGGGVIAPATAGSAGSFGHGVGAAGSRHAGPWPARKHQTLPARRIRRFGPLSCRMSDSRLSTVPERSGISHARLTGPHEDLPYLQ